MSYKNLPEYINGFKITKDFGSSGKRRWLSVICKFCNREFRCELQNVKVLKSCGCQRSCGYSSRLQRILKGMISRCYNPKQKNYSYYGGNGIRVCEDWLNNKLIFCKWAIDNGYKEDLTIDRICPELGYFPENCRWITMQEQIQRRRTITKLNPSLVKAIRKDLETMKNVDVAKKYGIHKVHVSGIKTGKFWNNI